MLNILERNAKKNPNKVIFSSHESSYSNKTLYDTVVRIINFYLETGSKKILLLSENMIDEIPFILASMCLNNTISIIDSFTEESTIIYIIDSFKPDIILSKKEKKYISSCTFSDVLTRLNNQRESLTSVSVPREETITLILFTSGTSGRPKGVKCTYKSVLFCINILISQLKITSSDKIGLFLPFYFDYGLYHIFFTVLCNASLVLIDNLSIISIHKIISENQITFFPSTPIVTNFFINKIKSEDYFKYRHLKKITNTGEHLSVKSYEQLISKLPSCTIVYMYGVTECKRISILDDKDILRKYGSVGKPLPGSKVYIEDYLGNLHKYGHTGTLIVEGPNVMLGYLNELDDSNFFKKNGKKYYRTGDIFYIDSEGYLYFKERSSSYFKKNGIRMSGTEIENLIFEVYPKNISYILFDKITSKIVLFTDITDDLDSIFNCLEKHIRADRIPDIIIKIKNIPLLLNGKVDKTQLLSLFYKEYPL